ncbi:hypothetical protein FKW77_002024 [Venturia effusa]|uniref:Uncharacterized protein n=1 Tax=Venturia effusa TaxID=50376 RepID=A0A517LJR1_9PEZI|nr:hypothetical protein FKW77_002024 [Venturia effusa]
MVSSQKMMDPSTAQDIAKAHLKRIKASLAKLEYDISTERKAQEQREAHLATLKTTRSQVEQTTAELQTAVYRSRHSSPEPEPSYKPITLFRLRRRVKLLNRDIEEKESVAEAGRSRLDGFWREHGGLVERQRVLDELVEAVEGDLREWDDCDSSVLD